MIDKVCPNGHHYNPDDNDRCPYCEKVNSYNDEWSEEIDIPEKTSLLGGWNNPTEQVNDRDFRTQAIGFQNNGNRKTSETDDRTRPVNGNGFVWTPPNDLDSDHTSTSWSREEYQQQPVVGWLVCIEGPDTGKDFPLHGAKSTIGRSQQSSVCLTDPKISRTGYPALIVYDDRKTHHFYLVSGDASSQNNVELDGNMLLGQSIIEPYSEIRIEDTALVFVPFCGDDFFWKMN